MRRRVEIGVACVLSAALAAVLGSIAVLVLLDVDTAAVGSGPEPTRVRFGTPIAWVTQDRSGYAPLPAGARVGFASPMEDPTTVSLPALGADVAIAAAVLTAGALGAALGVRRLTGGRRVALPGRRPA